MKVILLVWNVLHKKRAQGSSRYFLIIWRLPMAVKFHKAMLMSIVLACAVPAVATETEKRKIDPALFGAGLVSSFMAIMHGQVAVINRNRFALAYGIGEGFVALICFARS
jgi:hypothetical protein